MSINDLKYCSKNRTSNNIEILKESMKNELKDISFANVNLLINNYKTIEQLLLDSQFHLIYNYFKSHFITLVCLDNFNSIVTSVVNKNQTQVVLDNLELLLGTENKVYKDLEKILNTLNEEVYTQKSLF